jgi:L-threonylcarbamoyladenylate synthase
MMEILPFNDASIAHAAKLIAVGQPVAVPTETVYGLAADATNGAAVAAIYAAKGRPQFNPLIVHVPSLAAAEDVAIFDHTARVLAAAFWPGPLTLVLPQKPGSAIASLATAGLPTVAIRVPAHPAMRALLIASGKPLAAPSANASGRISPTRAAHVVASLGARISLVIDDGPCQVGLESTIVAVERNGLRLLRHGPISVQALQNAGGLRVADVRNSRIEAPGQLASHYAPSKPLRLNVTDAMPDEMLIGFGPVTGDLSLSPAANLLEAAAALFNALHSAEKGSKPRIAVAPIPMTGLGLAINDRLARAAHQ